MGPTIGTNQTDQSDHADRPLGPDTTFSLRMSPNPENVARNNDKSARTYAVDRQTLTEVFLGTVEVYKGFVLSMFKDAMIFQRHFFPDKKSAGELGKRFVCGTD